MTKIDTNFLKTGLKWDSASTLSLGYNFATTTPAHWFLDPDFILNYNPLGGSSSFNSSSNVNDVDQKDVIRYFLASPTALSTFSGDDAINTTLVNSVTYRVSFSDVINAEFSENENAELQMLNREGYSSSSSSLGNLPGSPLIPSGAGGDIIINQLDSGFNALQPGQSGFWLHLHELGHAVGGLNDVHETSQKDTYLDNQKYTMMSYKTYGGVYASGLQLLDIAALQDTYGTVNTNTRNEETDGDPSTTGTTYALGQGLGFDGADADDVFLYTIWDGGGNDTIDASGFNVAAEIDLREGRFSSIGKDVNGAAWVIDAAATPFDPDPGNVAIAYGTVIENAVGTAHADSFIGNDADNVFVGGAGGDTIVGGAGADTVDYSGDAAAGATGGIQITAQGVGEYSVVDGFTTPGTDTLSSIEKIVADSNFTNTLTLTGARSVITGDAIVLTDNPAATYDGREILRNIDSVNAAGDGYFIVENLGRSFTGLNRNDVLSYKNYGSALTFDIKDGTISDGTSTDTISDTLSIVGTDNGDTYTTKAQSGQENETDFFKLAHIHTGSGDDTLIRPLNPANPFGTEPVGEVFFYNGGHDTIVKTYPVQGLISGSAAVPLMILPFDVQLSDISFSINNITTFALEPGEPVYAADLTYQINGYGSITFEDGLTWYQATHGGEVSYTPHTQFTDLVLWTENGHTTLTVDAETSSSSVPAFEIRDLGPHIYNSQQLILLNNDAYHGTFGDDDHDLATYTGYDKFYAYDGNDTITGNANNNILYGGAGADTLNGGTGLDQLHGGVGNDTLNGGADNDTLHGEGGDDSLDGGAGQDTAVFSGSVENYEIEFPTKISHSQTIVTDLRGNDGRDTLTNIEIIQFADGSLVNGVFTGNTGTTFNDKIVGTFSSDVIFANLGADWVEGLAGNDDLGGGDGADRIDGGLDDDTVSGGAGGDVIYLGEGIDTVTGGEGEDIFVIKEGTATSIITDFVIGDDKIDLTNIDGIYEFGDISFGFGAGWDALLLNNGQQIRLNTIDSGNLSESDFIFGVPTVSGTPPTLPPVPGDVQDGTAGDDFLGASLSTGEVLNGYEGFDDLSGWVGDDYLNGGDDDDILYGDAGDDVLNGGLGYDQLDGGDGNDFYIMDIDDFDGDEISESDGIDHLIIPNELTTDDLYFDVVDDTLFVGSNNFNYNWFGVAVLDHFLSGVPGFDPAVEFIVVQDTVYDLSDAALNGFAPVTPSNANELPNAFDDVITSHVNDIVTGSVFDDNGHGADYDPNNIYLEVVPIDTQVAGGRFQLFADGQFTFTPTADFTNEGAPFSFAYTLRDADGNEAQANVSFEISLPPVPDVHFIEAEDMVLDNYEVAVPGNAFPSGGEAVRISGANGVLGSISTSFGGADYNYDISIAYFDETDGTSSYELRVNGDIVDSWLADSTDGSSSPNWQSTAVHRTLNVPLNNGDTIELYAQRDGGEFAYVDSLTFTPNTSLITATFAGSTDGFVYADDAFRGTSNPDYADGQFYTGALDVRLGGIDSLSIQGISGGWSYDFDLVASTGVELTFDYTLNVPAAFESDEYVDMLLSLNGTLLGQGGDDYLIRAVELDNSGVDLSGSMSIDLGTLAAGSHTITLGGYGYKKDAWDETAILSFDNIQLEQSDTVQLLFADFNGGLDDFMFQDDLFFGTNQGSYVYGSSGQGTLDIVIGGGDNNAVSDISGGWSYGLDLTDVSRVQATFDYSIDLPSEFEADEYLDMLLSVNGSLIGKDGQDYLIRSADTGDTGVSISGTMRVDLGLLAAGSHDIALGAYLSGKDAMDERAFMHFDNVRLDAVIDSPYPAIDFTGANLLSYGGQDVFGDGEVQDNGQSIHLFRNSWKAVEFDYDITANTVLEFDFKAGPEGEIHGIGFDNDLVSSQARIFQLHGTQDWGDLTFNTYDGSGDWVHYSIDVGSYYTGAMSHLVFVNDMDVAPHDAEGYFRNVTVYDTGDAVEKVLHGTDGGETLSGGASDDVIYGHDGLDVLIGGAGADTFMFDANALNDVDVVQGFSSVEGDALDIADLLTGYDPLTDAITDFVQITDNGTDSTLFVDTDGGADNFTAIATLQGIIGLTDETALENAGTLIAA